MTFESRTFGDVAVLVPTGLEAAGFFACFTERTGGVSRGALSSLNLSYSVGDDPDRVSLNRRRVLEATSMPEFALGGQVHGTEIARIGPRHAGAGYLGTGDVVPRTDGLHTSSRGVSLAVATADCVPVVLGSRSLGHLAVVHAGWRGVASGIIGKALSLFPDPDDVAAAVGPAAGGCCYEVGEDVASAVSAASPHGAVTTTRRHRLYLDIPATVASILRAGGVLEVEEARMCTIHEDARFFSHRRDPRCGRQMLIAMTSA